ncbi:PAS-domain containing protein [Meridianimarinicoccus sp. RP-17]|uniref:PAS-domain containing protein n=1 Tax=Meridianimarinicoccus zhengii TaxID=2056810 RepID=UPI000DAD4334|nr:PAS-domain containing protein [Phycocomes zhengii]
MLGFETVIAVGLASSLVTGVCLVLLPRLPRWRRDDPEPAGTALSHRRDEDIVFLFSGGVLVDSTPAARGQLSAEPAHADDLARFVIAYCQRFEGLSERLERFEPGDRFEIAEVPEDPDSLRLVAENLAGQLRIAITDPARDSRSEMVAHYSLAAMRAELFTLRSIAERSPIPTWKRRHDGTIIWANSTYMRLAVELAGEDALISWPPPDLFAGLIGDAGPDAPPPQRRVSLVPDTPQARTMWFDLIALPGEIETLYFALPIDNLVRAENALTEFVQTLTKTFAHLRIGLAIFDQKRRLALFNPALVDLTGLPAAQLSARPTLHAFLDALRDTQKIPEPKDYKSWRMQIAQLETGAAEGTYEDTWHLSNGQTFRVSGRPHPDGAVAYLFEDISSEVSMTRSFRSEIELSQSVVDSLDLAIAAFAPNGQCTLSNRAYGRLWSLDPGEVEDIGAACERWRTACQPGTDWQALRNRVLVPGERLPCTLPVHLRDGQVLRCDTRPIAGGATLVTFARLDAGSGAVTQSPIGLRTPDSGAVLAPAADVTGLPAPPPGRAVGL